MRKPDSRAKRVVFADEDLSEAFAKLASSTSEERRLYGLIGRALDDLKEDPFMGIKIPRKLWPREYVQKFGINNLWKYDLPNGWRLIYTVKLHSKRRCRPNSLNNPRMVRPQELRAQVQLLTHAPIIVAGLGGTGLEPAFNLCASLGVYVQEPICVQSTLRQNL